MSTVGERIKKMRENKGVSRASLAHALGVKETKIQDIERGKQKIPSDLLTKMSGYFGVKVEYILTGVGGMQEEGEYKKGAGALSREEQVLVEKYRALKPSDRTRAQAIVNALASTASEKGKTGGG